MKRRKVLGHILMACGGALLLALTFGLAQPAPANLKLAVLLGTPGKSLGAIVSLPHIDEGELFGVSRVRREQRPTARLRPDAESFGQYSDQQKTLSRARRS